MNRSCCTGPMKEGLYYILATQRWLENIFYAFSIFLFKPQFCVTISCSEHVIDQIAFYLSTFVKTLKIFSIKSILSLHLFCSSSGCTPLLFAPWSHHNYCLFSMEHLSPTIISVQFHGATHWYTNSCSVTLSVAWGLAWQVLPSSCLYNPATINHQSIYQRSGWLQRRTTEIRFLWRRCSRGALTSTGKIIMGRPLSCTPPGEAKRRLLLPYCSTLPHTSTCRWVDCSTAQRQDNAEQRYMTANHHGHVLQP